MFETSDDSEVFRAYISNWIEANFPHDMRGQSMTEDAICWGDKGWIFISETQRHRMERASQPYAWACRPNRLLSLRKPLVSREE